MHPTFAVHDGIFNGPSGLIGTGDYWGSDDGGLPRADAVHDGLFSGALGETPRSRARRWHRRHRNMQRMMLSPYAASDGVPNPFAPQVELYPNFVHGPDYSRPEFHFPKVRRNLDVLSGLGAEPGSRTEFIVKVSLLGAVGGGIMGAITGAIAAKSKSTGQGALRGALAGAAISGIGTAFIWSLAPPVP